MLPVTQLLQIFTELSNKQAFSNLRPIGKLTPIFLLKYWWEMEQLKIDKALDHVIFREIKPEKNSIMGIAKVKISNEVQ